MLLFSERTDQKQRMVTGLQ
jgi:hypothetical protein